MNDADTPDSEGSFADYPRSIAELRSDKTGSGADWTPRDALIAMLRDIDSGVFKPSALVISHTTKNPNGSFSHNHYAAAPDLAHMIMALQLSLAKLSRSAPE